MNYSASIFFALAVAFIAAGAIAGGPKPVAVESVMNTEATTVPVTEKTAVVEQMIEGDNAFVIVMDGGDIGKEALTIHLDDAEDNSDKALRLQDSLIEKRRIHVTFDAQKTIVDVEDI